jgi:pimeloyl-ACP methyl ester carboxylesterase
MTIAFSDSTVPVPGGSVFTRRWNSCDSSLAPIILLHDSLGCVDLWRDFPGMLADATARPVVAYDRLGFGRSTRREAVPAVGFIREEAEVFFPAIAKALGLSGFLLFGHSVGGAMALMIAALHPRNCQAVITESAQAFVEARTLCGIKAAKQSFANPEQFSKIAKLHGDKAQWVLRAWTEVWLSPEFESWSLDPYLSQVQCPVLAVHGDRDEYGSKAFPRRIIESVYGPSRLEILSDCGHIPHSEKRDEVLRSVLSFIKQYCG